MQQFTCDSCGGVALAPPDSFSDEAPVRCRECGRSLCTWGALRRQVAHALEEEPAWRRAGRSASPDPLPPPRPGSRRDRRCAERRAAAGAAVIEAAGAHLPCALRDLSGAGARLFLPGGQPLPETFAIRLAPDAPPRPARLVRRRMDEIGVAFVEP